MQLCNITRFDSVFVSNAAKKYARNAPSFWHCVICFVLRWCITETVYVFKNRKTCIGKFSPDHADIVSGFVLQSLTVGRNTQIYKTIKTNNETNWIQKTKTKTLTIKNSVQQALFCFGKNNPPRNADGKVRLPPLPWYPLPLLNSSQKSPAVVHHHRYHQFFHLLHFQPGLWLSSSGWAGLLPLQTRGWNNSVVQQPDKWGDSASGATEGV